MNRNVLGAFAIGGGLALWATIGASAQGSTTAAPFDPATMCPQNLLQLRQTLTGVSSAEATAQLQELNADAGLAQTEIIAETNDAITELKAEKADESGDEDATSALTLDAKILAIETNACAALGELSKDYNSAIAELTAEFTQPQTTDNEKDVDQPKPEKHDVEKDNEHHGAEQDKPETHAGATEHEGND